MKKKVELLMKTLVRQLGLSPLCGLDGDNCLNENGGHKRKRPMLALPLRSHVHGRCVSFSVPWI